MKGTLRLASLALAVGAFGLACTKVPYTGRHQFNLVPEAVMDQVGKMSYSSMLSGEKKEKSGDDAQMVQKVGKRIATVANKPDYNWRYTLIDSDTINAWCLPGGYIGVYTGILPVLDNEAGMAFVMGHEVGHAIAHHGAERLSAQLALFGGLEGLNLYLSGHSEMNAKQRALLLGAVGVGAEVGVMLPFSRAQESEADVIGIMLMSTAGYPPGESIKIWDRMDKYTGGSSIPPFLSDHPSDEHRKEHLKEWLPKAKKRYERHKLGYDTTARVWK